jgi:hypothetical protein
MEKIVVKAHRDHIPYLAEHMAAADAEEVRAAVGLSPYRGLEDSLNRSIVAWTGTVDGRPVCMFGVSPIDILCGIGSPWLLGTDEIRQHAKTFMKLNRDYIPKMLSLSPSLVNWVDARHETAIRWLKWLGFTFDMYPQPYGLFKLPFLRFHMEKK